MTLPKSYRRRQFWIQAALLIVVIGVLVAMITTARQNLAAQGLTSGFGFLERSTGWNLSFSLIEYSPQSTYARVLLVGFVNTLFAGFTGLALATLFGVMVGMSRVSTNATLNLLGATYVEIFRNVPLLMQVLFWYAIATHLAPPRMAEPILGAVYLTATGVYLPAPNLQGGPAIFAVVVSVGVLAITAHAVSRWLASTDIMSNTLGWLAGIGAAVVTLLLFAVAFSEPGAPVLILPEVRGFRIVGGIRIVPELSAMVMALMFYGTAYIGEIVRGGLLSVNKGQIEAGKALGLTPGQIYWKIRFPLALRSIVPAMGNQYIWLMKGTTVGLAIGFSDLFMVSSISINQSGQTLEIFGLMMLGFLVINLGIGTTMNVLNNAIALKGNVRTG